MARFLRVLFVLSSLFLSLPAWAVGALKTNISGIPFLWGENISYNMDQGALKSGVYDAAASRQLVRDAFAVWAGVPGVSLNIVEGSLLPDGGNTNVSNYSQFWNVPSTNCYDSDPSTPCYNPVIFDEDGGILEQLLGDCAQFSTAGFSGITDNAKGSADPMLTELKRGQVLFSGACISPAVSKNGCDPCKRIADAETVRNLILHETGHLLGLDHVQVNPDTYLACKANGFCSVDEEEEIPTMFPILVAGANLATLHRDDVVALQHLYGDPTQTHCTVSGTVFAEDGVSELRGVEVVARNINPSASRTDAISFISGAEAPRLTSGGKTQGNCAGGCGDYAIEGLTPGETYQLCVQKILTQFVGAASINPVDPPFQGFDNDCPAGLTVTCDCPSGSPCPIYSGTDIVTKNTGIDATSNLTVPNVSSGGCSLTKPVVKTKIWNRLNGEMLSIFEDGRP